MSDPESHTVSTQYGETTIDVYECDSCGNTVAHENTVKFTLGDREGRACEHCADTGPIGFLERIVNWSLPKRVVNWSFSKDKEPDEESGVVLFIVLAPIVLPLATIVGFRDGPPFIQGYAMAVLTLLVWVFLPLAVYLLL